MEEILWAPTTQGSTGHHNDLMKKKKKHEETKKNSPRLLSPPVLALLGFLTLVPGEKMRGLGGGLRLGFLFWDSFGCCVGLFLGFLSKSK